MPFFASAQIGMGREKIMQCQDADVSTKRIVVYFGTVMYFSTRHYTSYCKYRDRITRNSVLKRVFKDHNESDIKKSEAIEIINAAQHWCFS